MKMEQTVCSEMLAYKIQTPGNYPEENIQLFKICCTNWHFLWETFRLRYVLRVFLFLLYGFLLMPQKFVLWFKPSHMYLHLLCYHLHSS